MVNKCDIADPIVVSGLLAREAQAVAVFARTGEGVDKLRAALESELPRPKRHIDVLLPYPVAAWSVRSTSTARSTL